MVDEKTQIFKKFKKSVDKQGLRGYNKRAVADEASEKQDSIGH